MKPSTEAVAAALSALAIVQVVMLAALMSGTMPHPPRAIPLFAMGPFLGASLAIVVAAWHFREAAGVTGRVFLAAASVTALLSYGPQKWMDPAIAEIWPSVLVAEVAIVITGLAAVTGHRGPAAATA